MTPLPTPFPQNLGTLSDYNSTMLSAYNTLATLGLSHALPLVVGNEFRENSPLIRSCRFVDQHLMSLCRVRLRLCSEGGLDYSDSVDDLGQ